MASHRHFVLALAFALGASAVPLISRCRALVVEPVAAQAGGSRGRIERLGVNCTSKSLIGQFAFYRVGWSAGDQRVPIGAVGYAYFNGVNSLEVVETTNRDGRWWPEPQKTGPNDPPPAPSDDFYTYQVFADCSFRTRNAKGDDVLYGVIAGNNQLFMLSAPAMHNVVNVVAQRY